MKKYLLSFVLLLAAIYAKAQDQLYKKDDTKLLVKIIEISPDEIKYKLFDNQNGPTYTESKANVSLIIFQDGKHEVFNNASSVPVETTKTASQPVYNNMFSMSKSDSLIYYSYSNNISINFLSFFNNEVALMYQAEFFKSHFNIQIPVSFGVESPNITQNVYFGKRTVYSNEYQYKLHKKIFDVGFGINYYPTLESEVNYYIGPLFRFMQYEGTQTYSSYNNVPWPSPGQSNTYTKNSTLSRYTMGITNGVVFRTRSRLTATAYASIGFKNDIVKDKEKIKDPVTNKIVEPVSRPVTFYFSCGFNVGFNF